MRDVGLERERVTAELLRRRRATSKRGGRPRPVLVPVVAGLPTQLCAAALPEDLRRACETHLEDGVTAYSSTVACSGPLGLG